MAERTNIPNSTIPQSAACGQWETLLADALITSRLEDMKKLICLSFRDFIFDPKCLPAPQLSLIRHPRAIFFTSSSLQI